MEELKLFAVAVFAMLGFARVIFGCPECNRIRRRSR
jgi:hypothetical protein